MTGRWGPNALSRCAGFVQVVCSGGSGPHGCPRGNELRLADDCDVCFVRVVHRWSQTARCTNVANREHQIGNLEVPNRALLRMTSEAVAIEILRNQFDRQRHTKPALLHKDSGQSGLMAPQAV